MTQEPVAGATQPDQQDESVRDAIQRLYADGRAYAGAEVERQKLRAGIFGAGVRDALICAAIAIVLLFASLVAGLVGIIMALAPHIGAGWATFAVFGSAVLVALMLLLAAKARIARMKRAIK